MGACGIGAISKLDGCSSWCDVETVSVMWSHMRGGSTVKNPVMFKDRKCGSCSNKCTTKVRSVGFLYAFGNLGFVVV